MDSVGDRAGLRGQLFAGLGAGGDQIGQPERGRGIDGLRDLIAADQAKHVPDLGRRGRRLDGLYCDGGHATDPPGD